ncbi:MAG: hypothetical protein NTX50_11365 [Candidatus Sumerlaeota bacterium]|nr:hypothetical protein [Candidatus Sumerlaeota bacterium]
MLRCKAPPFYKMQKGQPYDFSVCCVFQLSDFFGQLVIALLKQLLLGGVPVFARPVASHQGLNDINDGKPLFGLMQVLSDTLAIKNGQIGCFIRVHVICFHLALVSARATPPPSPALSPLRIRQSLICLPLDAFRAVPRNAAHQP